MRYVPARRFSLLDDMFRDSFYKNQPMTAMKTNIIEKDGSYLFDMELPGYAKETIKIELNQGYLVVTAEKEDSQEEKDDQGNVIRKERMSGSCTRSFYIGEGYNEEDISAKFENGELKITLKAKSEEEKINKKLIAIS